MALRSARGCPAASCMWASLKAVQPAIPSSTLQLLMRALLAPAGLVCVLVPVYVVVMVISRCARVWCRRGQ